METSTAAATTSTDVLVKKLGSVSFSAIHHNMLELQRQLGATPPEPIDHEVRDTLFLFEPSPVITLGSSASNSDVLADNQFLQQQ